MRHLRQQSVEPAVVRLAPEPCFYGVGGSARALRLEQQVNIETVTSIGRDSAGGSVRLLDEPFFFETGQNVAHGCRRRNGFPRDDELTYQRSQDASRTVVCFHLVSG